MSVRGATEVMLAEEPDLAPTLADADTEAALALAATQARRFGITPRAFRRSVVATDLLRESYQRALYRVERRTLSLALAPGGNRSLTRVIPDPKMVDPWSVDPATVEANTRVSAICPDCDGSAHVVCGVCSGTTRARCDNCGGSGRVASQRKHQAYKNCPRCRGEGTRKCIQCRNGFVSCGCCGATGVVTAWLTLARATLSQVQVHPHNAATAVHYTIADAADFDVGAFVHTLTADTGARTQSLPTVPELHPAVDAWTDRVLSSRVQTFAAQVRRIGYTTAFAAGHIDVAGRPPAIASTSNWEPLRWRRNTILTTLLLGLVAAVVARWMYVARHEWYERMGDAGTVLSLCTLTALAAAWTAGSISVAARARSRVGLPIAMAATILASLATALVFVHARPSAAAARQALTRSAFAEARAEAQAMIDLDVDRRVAELVLDEIQLREILGTSTCHNVAALADYGWHDTTRRSQAVQHLQACVAREAGAAFSRRDVDALDRLTTDAAKLAPAEAAGGRWLASVLHACLAIEHDRISDAISSLQLIGELAPQVPDTMKPASFAALIVAAEPLGVSLAAVDRGSLRSRRQTLAIAIDQARAFAALTPLPPDELTVALGRRADKVRRQLARSERKSAGDAATADAGDVPLAQDSGAASEPPVATTPPPQPRPAPAAGEVLNPY